MVVLFYVNFKLPRKNLMTSIKTTYKPVWLSLLWSYILVWVPTIIYAARIATTQYIYDDTNLTIITGIFTKNQKTIPFYRITDIRAQKNIFGYGSIAVTDKMGATALRAIADPLGAARTLQLMREKAQTQNSVVHNEIF